MYKSKEIDDLLKAHLKPKEIIKRLDVHGSAITVRAKLMGLKFSRGRPEDVSLRKELEQLLLSGVRLTTKQLEAKLGRCVSGTVLAQIRRQLNIPRPPGGAKRSASMIRKIKILKSSGLTYSEIGKLLNISRQRAQQYIREPRTIMFCEKCGTDKGPLHSHHIEYDPPLTETLCLSCHSKEPRKVKKWKWPAARWTGRGIGYGEFLDEATKVCARIQIRWV